MYPEQPIMGQPINNSRNRLIVIVIVALSVLVLALGLWRVLHKSGNIPPTRGKVVVSYSPADLNDVSISFNGKKQTGSGTPPTYNLTPGTYSLTITTPGYKSFSAKVPVMLGKTVLVNAQLTPTTALTISNPSQITLPSDVSNVSIVDAQYFYNNSWAILHVNTATDSGAILVLRRSQTSGGWKTVLGPAIGFDPTSINDLPPLVQQYLNDNDYVVEGD